MSIACKLQKFWICACILSAPESEPKEFSLAYRRVCRRSRYHSIQLFFELPRCRRKWEDRLLERKVPIKRDITSEQPDESSSYLCEMEKLMGQIEMKDVHSIVECF